MHSTTAGSRPANTEQEIFDTVHGRTATLTLPPPEKELLRGIRWGLAELPFTPAFWAAQVWFERQLDFGTDYRWGATLTEEIVGCLLGGHGISWEVNHAAFCRLVACGVFERKFVPGHFVIDILSRPLEIKGRSIRYRFPKQKGAFVAEAINRVATERAPIESPLLFRDWLIGFRGIGPKTASWITRNFLQFPRVAVLDIHIFRACALLGLFSKKEATLRKYTSLESRYLELADALCVNPQRLDAVMWKTMRNAGRFATNMLPTLT